MSIRSLVVLREDDVSSSERVTKIVPPGGAGVGMHVIPVEQAISMEDTSISVEHISHWLQKYEGK